MSINAQRYQTPQSRMEELKMKEEWHSVSVDMNSGCWYCELMLESKGPHCKGKDTLLFSWEFDCYLHLSCLIHRLEEDSSDPEATLFLKEYSPSSWETILKCIKAVS